MIKTRHNYFQTKSKRTLGRVLMLLVVFLMGTQIDWAQPQKQIIGQFPFMDGGMEGQPATTTIRSNSTPTIAFNIWTVTGTGFTPRNIVNDNTSSRSGNMYFYGSGSSTQSFASPPAPSIAEGLQPSTSYVVQWFYKGAPAALPSVDNGNMRAFVNASNVAANGTESAVVTYGTAASTGWVKVSVVVSTSAAAAAANSYAGLRPRGATAGSFTASYDDYVVYQGTAIDETAPVAASIPVVSGLNVSWTASPDVDGGGYVVVRYATTPNADNDPNPNGIYAEGNTITNGTASLVGTVVYVGTATSFTDAVAGSASGTDFYKIYAVDKAFNYSDEIVATTPLSVNSRNFNENNVSVYKNNGVLYVNSVGSAIGTIKIFDIQGRLIAEQKNVNSNTATIKNLKATNQILIVKISSEDNIEVTKKVAN